MKQNRRMEPREGHDIYEVKEKCFDFIYGDANLEHYLLAWKIGAFTNIALQLHICWTTINLVFLHVWDKSTPNRYMCIHCSYIFHISKIELWFYSIQIIFKFGQKYFERAIIYLKIEFIHNNNRLVINQRQIFI